ncbi:hypothetical protein PCANC_14167 [Puccinia coronata f. sp. avenae]|uniref:Uncharacterized protein n=1 Tax=Puccinia coronata f. sp. avenae TaxID=200324 RepID=A0A2N5UK43_9BASI|nr:hypothetical protein PCANC_14167 [Puccinia coronata f. sp. avenae]
MGASLTRSGGRNSFTRSLHSKQQACFSLHPNLWPKRKRHRLPTISLTPPDILYTPHRRLFDPPARPTFTTAMKFLTHQLLVTLVLILGPCHGSLRCQTGRCEGTLRPERCDAPCQYPEVCKTILTNAAYFHKCDTCDYTTSRYVNYQDGYCPKHAERAARDRAEREAQRGAQQ